MSNWCYLCAGRDLCGSVHSSFSSFLQLERELQSAKFPPYSLYKEIEGDHLLNLKKMPFQGFAFILFYLHMKISYPLS